MILHCAQLAVDSGYVESSLIAKAVRVFRSMTERIFSDPELDTRTSADVMGVTADEDMAIGVLKMVSVAVEIGSSPCGGDDVSGIFRALSSGKTLNTKNL